MKKADGILCGDIHLRETTPICRTDDFMTSQWRKMKFIQRLQQKHDCDVYCTGDLFDSSSPSLWLVAKTMAYIPDRFYTILGQHDLLYHAMKNKDRCGAYLLEKAGKLKILDSYGWGTELGKEPSIVNKGRDIALWHHGVYLSKPPYPGCTDPKARTLLTKYDFDLIVTGDNHIPFTYTLEGKRIVNVGSMMRMDADQIDYEPAVWLWYADDNSVEKVLLPAKKGVVSRQHIEKVEERTERIEAFIKSLDKEGIDFVNFEQNLKITLNKNRVRRPIKEIIYEMIKK